MHTFIGKTRLELTEGDIAAQADVDAVVTAAHWDLLGGQGTDGIIHGKAGPALLEECRTIGACPIGDAVITRGYNLPAPYVIHAVGPVFETGDEYETELLTGAYQNGLRVAVENHLRRVAFPSIGTGAFVWPLRIAAPIALLAIVEFLQTEPHDLELVRLVLYKDEQPEALSIYEVALQKYVPRLDARLSGFGPPFGVKGKRRGFRAAPKGTPAMEIKDTVAQLNVVNSDLSDSSFDDVNLAHAVFRNINLDDATFTDVSLQGVILRDVNLSGLVIEDANTEGVRINGVLLSDLLAAHAQSRA